MPLHPSHDSVGPPAVAAMKGGSRLHWNTGEGTTVRARVQVLVMAVLRRELRIVHFAWGTSSTASTPSSRTIARIRRCCSAIATWWGRRWRRAIVHVVRVRIDIRIPEALLEENVGPDAVRSMAGTARARWAIRVGIIECYDVVLYKEQRRGEKNRQWGARGKFAHVDMYCATERLIRADWDHLFRLRNHACDDSIFRKYQRITVLGLVGEVAGQFFDTEAVLQQPHYRGYSHFLHFALLHCLRPEQDYLRFSLQPEATQ